MYQINYPELFHISIVTFFVHEISWLLLNLFYLYLDKYQLLQHYKITSKSVDWRHQISVFKELISKHFFLLLPGQILAYPLLKYLKITTDIRYLPNIGIIILQLIILNLIEDFAFYWVHRILHIPYLFKRIHHVHHKFDSLPGHTFSLNGEYAHWNENMLNDFGPMMFALYIWSLFGNTHIIVFWIWVFLRQVRTADSHSGYDFPYFPLKLFHFIYGGAQTHTFHHTLAGRRYNFGGLRIWDRFFGTEQDERGIYFKFQHRS